MILFNVFLQCFPYFHTEYIAKILPSIGTGLIALFKMRGYSRRHNYRQEDINKITN